MRKLFILLLVLLLPAIGLAKDATDNAPDFSGSALDGKQIAYSALKGKKPVYLMFWATW